MKFLKLKSILFSLMAIAMVTVFLTSCERDKVIEETLNENAIINHKLDAQLNQTDLHQKSLKIENRAQKNLGVNKVDFVVKSNDKAILEKFNAQSINLRLGEIELREDFEKESDEIGLDKDVESTDDLMTLDANQKFVQIVIEGSANTPSDENNLGFTIDFDETIQDLMKSNNIATIIDFGIEESTVKPRDYWIWSNNKRVKIKGDCGKIKTRTDNYYASYGQSHPNYYLNSSSFYCTAYTSVCCIDASKWVRRIIKKQDVIRSVSGIWSYCKRSTCR